MEISEEFKQQVREQVKKADLEQVEKKKLATELKRQISDLNVQKVSLLKGIGENYTWKRKKGK